jgi:mRNA interferase RelE/StbE
MAHYRVRLTPAARRQLDRLSGPSLAAVRGTILGLASDPRPPGAAKLAGTRDIWRIRLRIDGQPWRIVYQVRRRDRVVIVTRVARRDEGTYRGLTGAPVAM